MKTIICTLLISAFGVKGYSQCSNSIVFNDQSQSVFLQLSNSYYTANNGGFTWECWFKLNQPLGSEIRPLINAVDAVTFEDLWLGFGWNGGFFNESPSKLVFRVDGANSTAPVSGGCVYEPAGGFQVGTWYYVAGTMNYTTHTISLFVNGQQVDTEANNVTPITRIIPTALSCPQGGGSMTLNGNMDEVKIWSKPLSGAEIASNYLLCRSGLESHLEVYYHCNDGTGSQLLANSSASANLGNGDVPLPGGTWSVDPAPLTDHSCMPNCDCPALYTGQENLVVCAGDSIQLSAEPGWPFYNWYTSSGLVSSDLVNTLTVSPTVTTTYTVMASGYGPEMVVNGDFSLGNTGFTTGYINSNVYSPCNYHVGNQFFTLPDTTLVDHTPTNDNMMMAIDGCSGGEILWEQTFAVVPNASYNFSFWASRAAQVQPIFQTTLIGDITGPQIVSTLTGLPTTTQWIWDEYNGGGGVWSFGNNHTITITVRNLETNGWGNDFAMDDFSLKMMCNGIEQMTVYVNSVPLDLGPDITMCQGSSHVIHAGSNYASYLWNDGSTADSLVVTNSGTYWVTVLDNCGGGIAQTDTIHITTVSTSALNLGNDLSICAGDTVHFLPVSGFANYVWSGAGLSCVTCANPDVFPPVSTDFALTATTSGGCSVTDSVSVTVVPLQQVQLGNDLFTCSGDSILLGNIAPLNNYQWSPAQGMSCTNCANPLVSPTVSITYVLTTQNVLGCTSSDSIRVGVFPLPGLELGNDLTICKGESTSLHFTPDPAFSIFQWTPAIGLSCTSCPNPDAGPSDTTLYFLQTSTSDGCIATDSITVIVKDDAPADVLVVVTDATCELPGTVAVEAVGNGSGDLQYNFNHQGFQANPFYPSVAAGNYILVVRNGDDGCPYQTFVKVGGEQNIVFIPNAFTPDGNDANNVWGIQGTCIDKIVCRIFNRWGEEIVTLTDPLQQWDGTFEGSIVPDGVYTYQVEVTYASEYKELITGSVAVLR